MRRILRGGWAAILACAVGSIALGAEAGQSGKPVDKHYCQAGELKCVHHVIGQMDRRLSRLAKSCDHDAIFALVYLRTTEKYGDTAEALGYEDVSSVTREDALFAEYYFRAYDAFHEGRLEEVPPVWQIALSAAEGQTVATSGNALLGFAAHILRDLPFVLEELDRNGTPVSSFDHLKVNEFLAQVRVDDELVQRFDPTYPTGGDPSFIFYWRALAWTNYRALMDAPTQEARAEVAYGIEQAAAFVALQTVQATSYTDPAAREARNAYCAENAWPE